MAFEHTPTEALEADERALMGLMTMAVDAGLIVVLGAIGRRLIHVQRELSARRADVPHHTNRFNDAAYVASFAG